MAVLTYVAARDMCRVLSGSSHSIVAAAAIANHTNMIKVGRSPCGSAVAIITGIGAGDVRRMFSGGGYTVVAGSAAAYDLGMIDRYRRRKGDDAVAVLTNSCGLNMRSILASRVRAVVATDAITCDIDVIKIRRRPGHG